MEFFNKAKAVRLKSHHNKYLIADDDDQTVRQSRNGSSRLARWTVEFVEGNSHAIRLKNYHEMYLTASDEPFLLGMTGKKVVQSTPASQYYTSVEWEPIKEGVHYVKLRSKEGGKLLRANGGTPPWRNSVTHDFPRRTATQDWVLWEIEIVDISLSDFGSLGRFDSAASQFFLARSDLSGSYTSSPSESPHSYAKCVTEFTNSDSPTLSFVSQTSPNASTRQNGMVFFDKAKAVRLQNHHGKYLVADDDETTVRQSRNGSSPKAHWTVEFITGKDNKIRLKSCHGFYLTATDDPFLLGMTGKKVVQFLPATKTDSSTEWEPIKEGLYLKLKTNEGNFLRANWGTPPWRNSVTHDIPQRSATQDWVLWGVEVVDIVISQELPTFVLSVSRFSSMGGDIREAPDCESPVAISGRSRDASVYESSGMEFFKNAKSVRLKSHHDKYLIADDDRESVFQDRHGSIRSAVWTVEFVDCVGNNVVRLKSFYGQYLTATDQEKILGLTGRKVLQTMPRKLNSSVEWEPVRDGTKVKLKTRYGNYLRANGGLPPWRNSITHDIPHRHFGWILWDIDIVEWKPVSPKKEEIDLTSSTIHLRSPKSSEGNEFVGGGSSGKSEGRMIHYLVVDDNGNVDQDFERNSFIFKGHTLDELTQRLMDETGLEKIIVCSRNPLNGKLYPLRLALPPNNATMNIVVVPTGSRAAKEFALETAVSI